MAKLAAQQLSREEAWYWLLFDPARSGFYAMFAPTAYAGGFHAAMLTAAIAAFLTATLLIMVLAPAEARSARQAKQQA